MLATIFADVRYTLRQLRRAPGFTLATVLTLALGIGANTAMFSLLDQALLRALPVRYPQELVALQGTGRVWEGSINNWGVAVEAYFRYPMYRDLRDHDHAFQGSIATVPAQVAFAHAGEGARALDTELVSGNYFQVLGVRAAAGRLLALSDDTQPGANPVAGVNRNLAMDHMLTMHQQIDTTMNHERLIALLAISFGVLAAALAGVGLYGVLAFVTAQRTREIGVRMALGASRDNVSRLALSDVLKLPAAGVLAAIPVTLLLGRLVQSQLFGIFSTDPVSFTVAITLLAAAALLASALPARRVASVNPTEALRTE